MLLSHALSLSANQFFMQEIPNEYVHSVRMELTIDFSWHEDNLPSHRGRLRVSTVTTK